MSIYHEMKRLGDVTRKNYDQQWRRGWDGGRIEVAKTLHNLLPDVDFTTEGTTLRLQPDHNHYIRPQVTYLWIFLSLRC